MPSSVRLSPGPWPHLQAGTIYMLAPGLYPPLLIPDIPDLGFRALDGPAIIQGALSLGDEPPCAVRAMDGCDRLLLEGLEASCATGRGIRITVARQATVRRCRSLANLLEALTLASCPDVVVEAGEFGAAIGCLKRDWPTGGGWLADYPPDRRHALYLSHRVDGARISDCILRDVPGSALQINGKDGPIRGVSAQRLQLLRSGSSGTLALSLMGVTEAIFDSLFFDGNNRQEEFLGRLFEDGDSGPCQGVAIRNFSPAGRFDVQGGSANQFTPGAGWRPGASPPPLLPPPAPAAQTLEERVAELERDFDGLTARVASLERG